MHARSFSFSTAPQPLRPTRCYHCAHDFLAPLRAQTLTCPRCTSRLDLSDLLVRGSHTSPAVRTAGRLIVPLRATLHADSVDAMAGFECLGTVRARLRTVGPAFLGPRSSFTGSLHAAELVVSPGARLDASVTILPAPILSDPLPAPAPRPALTRPRLSTSGSPA